MTFPFYPAHEHHCPHLGYCPHLGGAALGNVVRAANQNLQHLNMLHRQLDELRQQQLEQTKTIAQLNQQVEQLQAELKLERQKQFKKNHRASETASSAASGADGDKPKRGAPKGHPGWFRPRPDHVDHTVWVPAPEQCPHCDGLVRLYPKQPAYEHLQEDLAQGQLEVTCFCHPAARCTVCRQWVQQAGEEEILGCRVGPHLRAIALFLKIDIGLTTRQVVATIRELTGLTFTPAALLGFEARAAQTAAPLAADIAAKLRACDVVHADESYWSIDGQRAYVWVHGNDDLMHFVFDFSRRGQVSRDLLGEHFAGVLITDCYSGYRKHAAKAKQKCLAHLRRSALDWTALVRDDSAAAQFFADIVAWVKRACAFDRKKQNLSHSEQETEEIQLRKELTRLESCPLDHDKARQLQQRLRDYPGQWLVFLDIPGVAPTNNLAERALRPLVVLRKRTFGNRSVAGAERLGVLMSVIQTAKRQGRSVCALLKQLFLKPPAQLLGDLYAPT